jgi:hypothetical protein
MAGAAEKFVVILCPVENMSVLDLATRVSAELVRCVLMLAATVVRSRRPCYVPTVATKSKAAKSTPPRTVRTLSRNGMACSLAPTLAIVPLTVVFTTARSLVTLKIQTLVTALALLTSSHTVLVARPSSRRFHLMLVLLVKTPSRTVRRHA